MQDYYIIYRRSFWRNREELARINLYGSPTICQDAFIKSGDVIHHLTEEEKAFVKSAVVPHGKPVDLSTTLQLPADITKGAKRYKLVHYREAETIGVKISQSIRQLCPTIAIGLEVQGDSRLETYLNSFKEDVPLRRGPKTGASLAILLPKPSAPVPMAA